MMVVLWWCCTDLWVCSAHPAVLSSLHTVSAVLPEDVAVATTSHVRGESAPVGWWGQKLNAN